ncbi:hypothetical protein [Curtobacterium sp. MCBD17_023]|uniref:hypothetical protein n=1 Tax=Curtobacterium sp. MCBD17_023 TaxID=2175657 RepID=UPI0011B60695|nr:hypothetical protein [Curtobacterium sp. MCBD17_023]
MNTEPPTGDDLQRMLVSMKHTVLDRAEDRRPAPRRRGRRAGVAIGVIALLGLGATSGAVALGMIPQPFTASAPAPSPSPTGPAMPSTPAAAPVREIPDPTPTPTGTKGAFALNDPSTWTISGSEVGPIEIGGEFEAEGDDLRVAYRSLPPGEGSCTVPGTWAREGYSTIELAWEETETSGALVRSVSGVLITAEDGGTPTSLVPGPTTAAGIGVGSTIGEVRAVYSTLVNSTPDFSGPGSMWDVTQADSVLRFQVGTDGEHVNAIWVSTDPNRPMAVCGA